MSIAQKEIKKHIDECKFLIKGTFHRISYDRNWDIVVHFCWTSDDSVNFSKYKMVRKTGNILKYIIFDDYLSILNYEEKKIEIKIKQSKPYKEFHKRIKDECKWAKHYEKVTNGDWEIDVLAKSENDVVYHYEEV